MPHPHIDRLLGLIAATSLAAVAIALISQHVYDMPPCAYCVFQRLLFVGMAVFAILALLVRRLIPLRLILIGVVVALGIGGVAAAWYQHTVASHLLSCAQTFADRFMTQSGLEAALPSVFGIYASCADASVDLLGMKYELWSMALFAVLSLVALVAAVRTGRAGHRLFS